MGTGRSTTCFRWTTTPPPSATARAAGASSSRPRRRPRRGRAKKADKKKEIDLTEMTPAELNDLIKKATALKKKDGKKAAK